MSGREDHLQLEEAATVLGITRRTLYRYISEGRIAAFKHAGRSYIHRKEIDKYFERLQMEGDKQRTIAERRTRRKSVA